MRDVVRHKPVPPGILSRNTIELFISASSTAVHHSCSESSHAPSDTTSSSFHHQASGSPSSFCRLRLGMSITVSRMNIYQETRLRILHFPFWVYSVYSSEQAHPRSARGKFSRCMLWSVAWSVS